MNDFIEQTVPNAEALSAQIANIKVPPAPVGSRSGGGAQKMIKNPVDGTMVSRTDYMRALAANGWTRPDIAEHIKTITGEEVRYQTVHQATKDFYPKRTASAPGAAGGDVDAGEGEYEDEE